MEDLPPLPDKNRNRREFEKLIGEMMGASLSPQEPLFDLDTKALEDLEESFGDGIKRTFISILRELANRKAENEEKGE